MQFTIFLHYPPLPSPSSGVKPTSFTATIRGTLVSILSTQLRYVVRGTRGTYTKFGVDPQEDQLKVISSPNEIVDASSEQYGREPESIYATLENFAGGGATEIVRST